VGLIDKLRQSVHAKENQGHERRGIRMKNTSCVLRCFLIITLFASTAFAQAPLTARDVIAKMAGVYAQSASYRDEGQATNIGSGRVLSFTTLFDRPKSSFKFEYTSSNSPSPGNHIVLWRTTPGDVRMWSARIPQIELKSMQMAIASVTGVSGGSGHDVPVLLMREEGFAGFSLSSDWMDAALPEEEMVDGRACYKISGHYLHTDDALSVWIDKQTFLIRKIVDKRHTITYSPQVNIPIDAALFAFQPPANNPGR
jgi:hypothetical protein